jgi:hypothetical protein
MDFSRRLYLEPFIAVLTRGFVHSSTQCFVLLSGCGSFVIIENGKVVFAVE